MRLSIDIHKNKQESLIKQLKERAVTDLDFEEAMSRDES